MAIDLDAYNTVPERIAEFAQKYPTGCLQRLDLQFVTVAGMEWIVYTAAALRTPDDMAPGHGTAWERVPGLTPYTKNSELQNAETSAWGRAIVAVLAADTRKGVASRNEVEARNAERVTAPEWKSRVANAADLADLSTIHAEAVAEGWATPDLMQALTKRKGELGVKA
jgi:hypothetical protein